MDNLKAGLSAPPTAADRFPGEAMLCAFGDADSITLARCRWAPGLQEAAPASLGLAMGATSPPAIRTCALSRIAPQERTTPAGRIEAALGLRLSGKDIPWVDDEATTSLLRLIAEHRPHRRQPRLETSDRGDHRLSYGRLNAPVACCGSLVSPAFGARLGQAGGAARGPGL